MKRKYYQSIIILLTVLTVACQSSNEKSDINPAAYSPVAEAGADQTVSQGATVILDGSASFDPDGAIVTYLWEQTGGTAVGFVSSATQISFTAPQPAGTSEALTFLLTVTDNSGTTASDTVTVTVHAEGINLPPSAVAGADQTVSQGDTVTLDGTGSTDPDGSIVSYLWEQTAGTSVDFDHSSAQPGFTAPQPASISEALTFLLTVTDDSGATASDSVTVIVTAIFSPIFSDDFSSDSRSDYLVTHTWTQGGIGEFLYDVEGERLQVTTGNDVSLRFDRELPLPSESGILQMDFLPTTSHPLGGAVTIYLMQDDQNYYEIVNTDGYGPGTVNKVVNGTAVDSGSFTGEYCQNTPYHITVMFTGDALRVEAFGDSVTLAEDYSGISVKEFRVKLAQQDAYFDNFSFAIDVLNFAPVADPGANQTAYKGDTVTLDGSGSMDPDGTIVGFLWEQTGGTAVTFDTTSMQPTFTASEITGSMETFTFILTVTDDAGATDSDSVTVTILAQGSSAFSDDFSTDTRSDYTVAEGEGQFLYDAVGRRLQIITGDDVALRFDHATPTATENGVLQMDFLPTTTHPSGGIITIWLMQDDQNYYEIVNTDGYGPGTISKVVNGVVVDSAAFSSEYGQNTTYQLTVIFKPDTFSVDFFGDLLSLTADSTAIFVEEFRVKLAQQDAYIDNIFFSDDISSLNDAPTARFQSRIEQPLSVVFNASTSFDPDGSITQYSWDFGDGETALGEIVSHVYASSGTYPVVLTVTDDDGADGATSMNIQNDTDYYVAIGNSITKGSHDDISSDGIGYEPILETLLDDYKSYPSLVYNEGVSGDSSEEGLDRLPAILDDHPNARYYLVMYGTNDAFIPVSSGLGLLPGDTGYAGSYKDNMQTMITAIINRGKIPYLAKLPYATGDYADLRPPIEEYNDVIEELSIENGIDVIPPDFYCLFESNPERLADGLHPDGQGYQLMAQWWFDALTGVEHEECY